MDERKELRKLRSILHERHGGMSKEFVMKLVAWVAEDVSKSVNEVKGWTRAESREFILEFAAGCSEALPSGWAASEQAVGAEQAPEQLKQLSENEGQWQAPPRRQRSSSVERDGSRGSRRQRERVLASARASEKTSLKVASGRAGASL